jgi:putative ABC transport system permease protein
MKAARHIPVGWRQLKHNRLRLLAALAGITFAAVLMLVQLGFRAALFDSGIRWHTAWAYDIAILSPKSEYLLELHDIPRVRVFQAGGVDGVRAVTPVYTKLGKWRNPEKPKTVWPIFVAAFDPADEGFGGIISPQQQQDLRLDDNYLFDSLSRPEYGPIPAMLDTEETVALEMNGRRIRISGLFEVGNSFGINGALITSDLNFLRMFPNRNPSAVTLGLVQLEVGAVAEEVRDAIAAALPADITVVTKEQFKAMEVAYWDGSTPIGYVLNLGVLMGLVVGAIIVYQILFSDVQDHLKEYATLKAMGYTNGYLSGVVLQEAAILAVAGFIPAIALSLAVFKVSADATNLPLELTPDKAGMVFGLTLVMCAFAGLLAMRKVRSADPADVF